MRYLLLVLLNLPILGLALINGITQYKLGKLPKSRYYKQMVLWTAILIVLVASFPIYNLMKGHPILDSRELSIFDIVEITVIIFLMYSLNSHRQKIDQNQKNFKELHQELSIRLSKDESR